ncbi:GGDEF domain-containing response regulator [Deinococcus aquiradiocola]|uniref:Diguanylate cyclase response regulator n=1 Tax=Deinococcus aquiradiocola TaxID=393059 RepID=A0A917PG29_9DEIO|nr:diguanylate cyclase [Deinococcus aquiradiocola]GGJ76130.1 diguanylate cyclase response regulator [Deinococcus aquiradiocola]
MNVLIVDDSPLMRAMLASALTPTGAAVTAPATLDDARTLLGMPGGVTDVDVLLLDLVMPDTDGLTFLRELRAHPHLEDLSVIMVTAMQEEDRLDEAFAAGANDYVTKPVRPGALCARASSAARLTRALRSRREREAELKMLNDRLADLNAQLETLSLTDGLTGISNRRAFDQGYERALALHTRTGLPVTLLLLDIDHFKRYNDTLGHPAGDACLQQVARVVRSQVNRAADVVARYGGEEFAVLLLDTHLQGGRCVADRILAALRDAAIPHPAHPLGQVTVSIGVAGHGLSGMVSLKDAADEALYRAKAAGRARAVVWGETDAAPAT